MRIVLVQREKSEGKGKGTGKFEGEARVKASRTLNTYQMS